MKKDLAELKKRITIDDSTFTQVHGCYIDSDKNIITKFSKSFATMEDDETFKYLEIVKKVLSGKYGNAVLNLPITDDNSKKSLKAIVNSGLKQDSITDTFYQQIIDSYDYNGNYIILLFHDSYDIITRTRDNSALDESEEVFEYILCAICPVSLSTPGLSYYKNNNEISTRIRDWVVGTPDTGFVYPAFENRTSDEDSLLFYNRKPALPHIELAQIAFGCGCKMTSAQKKNRFNDIIHSSLGEYQDNLPTYKALTDHLLEDIEYQKDNNESLEIKKDTIKYLFNGGTIADQDIKDIEDVFEESFDSDTVMLSEITNQSELEKISETISAMALLQIAKEELQRLDGDKHIIQDIESLLDS